MKLKTTHHLVNDLIKNEVSLICRETFLFGIKIQVKKPQTIWSADKLFANNLLGFINYSQPSSLAT